MNLFSRITTEAIAARGAMRRREAMRQIEMNRARERALAPEGGDAPSPAIDGALPTAAADVRTQPLPAQPADA